MLSSSDEVVCNKPRQIVAPIKSSIQRVAAAVVLPPGVVSKKRSSADTRQVVHRGGDDDDDDAGTLVVGGTTGAGTSAGGHPGSGGRDRRVSVVLDEDTFEPDYDETDIDNTAANADSATKDKV